MLAILAILGVLVTGSYDDHSKPPLEVVAVTGNPLYCSERSTCCGRWIFCKTGDSMQKYFNINGVCSPDRHYMVNIEDRLQQAKKLVDRGDYFVINRARQYGKTTILNALSKKIAEEYTVFFVSFESCGNAMFENEDSFCRSLCGLLYDTIDYGEVSEIPQEL